MKFIAISDTHGQHDKLSLPEGDIVIHAGDISGRGTEQQVRDFLEWFSSLDHRYKIFIAGNHDFFLEKASAEIVRSMIPSNVIYLNDSAIEIEGIKIWGSPVQPWFHDWAFNRQRGADIRKHWNLIPPGTDVLITHGPAFGILDRTVYGHQVGCVDLLEKIQEVKPRVHVCGHIHEAYGVVEAEGVKFINASVLNEEYFLANSPCVFEFSSQ